MQKMKVLVVLIVFFVLSSCMPAKKVWTSSPPLQSASNPYFKAEFEPLKGKSNFYTLFHLTVANKTDRDLELLWSETRYLKDGQDKGTFVYSGIGAENVKNPPPEIIKAGETLTRDLCPTMLVAYVPLREKSVQPGERGIMCGFIPPGEHGILITVRDDGKNLQETLAIKIIEQEAR